MASFTYIAKRSIKAGHSVDTEYTITVDIQQGTLSPRAKKSVSTALSGNTVSTLHRVDQVIDVLTDYVSVSGTPDQADFTEFLNSVIAGESFVFNGGTAVTVIMEGDPVLTRDGLLYTYSFKMRLLS